MRAAGADGDPETRRHSSGEAFQVKYLALRAAVLALWALVLLPCHDAQAARESRVSQTKHNLSSSNPAHGQPGVVSSPTESQICVFCHTPHGADASQPAPLWNKTIQSKTYTPYTSSSFDAAAIQGTSAGQPLGSSKLCLSCHDGAMQIGAVRVLRGQTDQVIPLDNTNAGTMPDGKGLATGFTRNLGGATHDDLSNDHPISVTYDTTLTNRDGELRVPDVSQRFGNVFGKRVAGDHYKPMLPLETTGAGNAGQIQCTTCHDPHIRETNLANEKTIKFLRANRFQLGDATSTYNAVDDIICLACHDKGLQGNGTSWVYSAHANSQVATQTYKSGAGSAAENREFPDNLPVWKAACLNCHDTHTVSGARRLLREGTDSALVGGVKSGGDPALEEVCYQCHRDSAGSILNSVATVPNIKADFELAGGYRMPIRTTDQDAAVEVHDIGGSFDDGFAGSGNTGSNCSTVDNKCGADFVESRAKLGVGAPSNRHVECTDCHNPHRVVKFRLFYGAGGNLDGPPDGAGTHNHTDTAGYTHTNVASGVLRGAWGVEPSYGSASFHVTANNYTVRRGDPGNDSVANSSIPDNKPFVTREYQICLKCHSTYGYSSPPNLRLAATRRGLTASGTNGLGQYTDQAKEFQAPTGHDTEPANLGTAAGNADANSNANNHRSWHPVMRATGRTLGLRGITRTGGTGADTFPWRRPWLNDVGAQTMYCTDCHGSGTDANKTVIPNGGEDGNPWGPHGSANPFILKAPWSSATGTGNPDDLCFKCHDYDTYARGKDVDSGRGCNDSTKVNKTGFSDTNNFGNKKGDLHCYHQERISSKVMRCSWCHVAVPHGWKNKALLANLNDVGEEAGQPVGSSREVAINDTLHVYNQGPYYMNAKLKVRSFNQSGRWAPDSCGARGKTGANLIAGSGGLANNTNTGVNWMKAVCNDPP